MTINLFETYPNDYAGPQALDAHQPLILNFRPNYESVENHQTLHNQVVRISKCQVRRVRTWYEFIESIRDERPALITIHYSVINYGNRHISEFISFIQGLTEYMTKNNATKLPIPIAIEVDASCPTELVTVLRYTDAVGIIPTADSFGVDRTVESLKQVVKMKSHWPADIINQLPSHPPTNKPINLYFRKNWKTYLTPASRIQMHENIPWDPMYCDSWDKFVLALRDTPPGQIEFHISLVEESGLSPAAFVALISNLVAAETRTNIPIAVAIEPDTQLSLVKELKSAGVFGIVPSSAGFGADSCKIALKALFDRVPHWPTHILNRLPDDTTTSVPRVIYYNDDHSQTIKCTSEITKKIKCTYTLAATWRELTQELETGAEYLVFHIDMIIKANNTVAEFIDAVATVTKFMPGSAPIKIAVIITPTTDIKLVKQLQKTTVLGVALDLKYFSIDEVAVATKEFLACKPYWPKHILSQLPGTKPVTTAPRNGIVLTARQQEVMDLICHRGLSNKQIAKTLKLSESTVKIHVSAIMRAYGVRNRTQLALSAGVGLKA